MLVGLGNPGTQYGATRHNAGFMLADLIARRGGSKITRGECRSLVGRAVIASETVELVKPQTYMNLSGEAVSCLLKKPERSIEKLIVVSDDLALPLGKIRIRPAGTHGGHNGLRSIIECLGTQDFIRLRIGIMPETPVANTKRFVLDDFSQDEVGKLDEILTRAADAVGELIAEGVDRAMARFN